MGLEYRKKINMACLVAEATKDLLAHLEATKVTLVTWKVVHRGTCAGIYSATHDKIELLECDIDTYLSLIRKDRMPVFFVAFSSVCAKPIYISSCTRKLKGMLTHQHNKF